MATADKNILNYVTSISALSGFILYHIRNQMGLNHREIAKIFDITHTTYGNMERGDTSINTDFIYMLCTLSGIKFSHYFSLLEDLIINIEKIERGLNGEKIKIKIIPSTDLQKIIIENAKNSFSIAPSPDNLKNLLIGQDINLFISRDLKERLSIISPIRFTKEQVGKIGNLTSHEVEETLQRIKNIDTYSHIETETNINSLSSVTRTNTSLAEGVGMMTSALVGGIIPSIYAITAGYNLYKTYKQTKEEKKLKK